MFGREPRHGPSGFLQYQFVPTRSGPRVQANHRRHQAVGHYSFLNVFKLFGPGSQAPLASDPGLELPFPIKGLNQIRHQVDPPILEFGVTVHRQGPAPRRRTFRHVAIPAASTNGRRAAWVGPRQVFVRRGPTAELH